VLTALNPSLIQLRSDKMQSCVQLEKPEASSAGCEAHRGRQGRFAKALRADIPPGPRETWQWVGRATGMLSPRD